MRTLVQWTAGVVVSLSALVALCIVVPGFFGILILVAMVALLWGLLSGGGDYEPRGNGGWDGGGGGSDGGGAC